jgi:hypothetical protein
MRNGYKAAFGALAAVFAASAVHADPVVDGVLSAGEYGAPTATVAYDANAPQGNFQSPGPTANVAYNIYQTSANGYYYALFQALPAQGGSIAGPFVNAYYDLDPAANNGSDVLFSINGAAGTGTAYYLSDESVSVPLPGLTSAVSQDGTIVEFSLPVSDFTGPIAGLPYDAGQGFPVAGAGSPAADITLRLSQSFTYSVAGGTTYGADRLGTVTLAAAPVPEPGSMSLLAGAMLLGAPRLRRFRAGREPALFAGADKPVLLPAGG